MPAEPPDAEEFRGFPPAAFEFYEDLEEDNSKTFWTAHKDQYDQAVRRPMLALAEGLREDFGPAKVFRPHRDLRFSNNKTPYKTHQGAFVARGPATGWYAEISAPGFRCGAGFYRADGPRLRHFREAVTGPLGDRLCDILGSLESAGWEIGGERLKRPPRGFAADHPNVELLKHKSLSASRGVDDATASSPALLDRVRADWTELRPLLDWLAVPLG